MAVSARDIEKLKAIGYEAVPLDNAGQIGIWYPTFGGRARDLSGEVGSAEEAWEICKVHSQSPGAIKATMADKVAWLGTVETIRAESSGRWFAALKGRKEEGPYCDSPEAAVDALFWKVP